MAGPAPLGVYLHWPYCARICPYCDFNVRRDRGRSAGAAALVEAMVRDLQGQARLMEGQAFDLVSIYFGGGTPSLMAPAAVARLVGAARALWPATGEVEVTLEANPGDLARLDALRAAGVERLSLGVQSLDDPTLAFLKRDHDARTARLALERALTLFPRVSLDLIYALPGQGVDGWAAALDEAAGLGPSHISAYQLGVEAGTPFDRARRRGQLQTPGEEEAARLYETTLEVLGARGFQAYEVSNFARGRSARSRHNLLYWRGEAYVGAGPGAHGRLPLAGARTATEGERDIAAYIAAVEARGVGWSVREPLSDEEALEERLLLGLRSDEGAPLAALRALGREGTLAPLLEGGWLRRDGAQLHATAAGRLLLDSVTGALLA